MVSLEPTSNHCNQSKTSMKVDFMIANSNLSQAMEYIDSGLNNMKDHILYKTIVSDKLVKLSTRRFKAWFHIKDLGGPGTKVPNSAIKSRTIQVHPNFFPLHGSGLSGNLASLSPVSL